MILVGEYEGDVDHRSDEITDRLKDASNSSDLTADEGGSGLSDRRAEQKVELVASNDDWAAVVDVLHVGMR